MGAWGTKPFENDGALDLLAEIRHGDFSFDGIAWAFEDPDYLEIDGGQIAVALAALVRITRGDADVATSEFVPEDLGAFASLLTPERIAWIQRQLDRTLAGGDASELYELWEETGDFEEWLSVSRVSLVPAA
ncbi:DUF4259 domain-containing protein [Pseudoclavibacter chungangensis]|uniref:DUF4259 domain-containing protein n=1 Tax=Pseudoclavibacter chungangensis TaxID=587635 RepID=A0A7J5BMP3_9MICO|nr:DUF4259 domain-containing protein [Pseudoclavibacter chungangensis]KAB1652962.1 DUF4259 domain-containing protein [Pseudoclavibacter chungangensis]NYJ65240.1 hypothetical protein [Pseudoclavibacter chungangensis]